MPKKSIVKLLIVIFSAFSMFTIGCQTKEQHLSEISAQFEDPNSIEVIKQLTDTTTDREIKYSSHYQIIEGGKFKKTASDFLITVTFLDSKKASLPFYERGDFSHIPSGKLVLESKNRKAINFTFVYYKPDSKSSLEFYKITSNSTYDYLFVSGGFRKSGKEYSKVFTLFSSKKAYEVPKNTLDIKESFTVYCD